MESIATAIRNKLEKVGTALEEKYPGVTEDLLSKFFEGMAIKPKAVKKEKVKAEEAIEVPVLPDNKSEGSDKSKRARTVSKKMKEAFLELAGSNDAKLVECTKSYKAASEEDLQAKGGNFVGFARSFLGLAEVKVAKPKAKKEKAPSRIDRWTPTLTRQLTKIVEESGGKMDDSIKKSFHSWIDLLGEEEFNSAAIEGHMRKYIADTLRPAALTLAAPAEELDADDDEMEDLVFDGEELVISVGSGKIYRASPAGDIWIGNAGVGKFAKVAKPA